MPIGLDGYGNGLGGGTFLISNAEAEEYLGTTFASQDVLTEWIARCESAIARRSGRVSVNGQSPFVQLDEVEYYDGNAESAIWLRRWPVIDVADVRVDPTGCYGASSGAFGDDTALDVGTQYHVPLLADPFSNRGRLVRTDGRKWPEGRGNIQVTYLAGYDPIPDDLKLLVFKVLRSNLAAQSSGIEGCASSVTHGQFSITFADRDRNELDSITSLMAKFVERV